MNRSVFFLVLAACGLAGLAVVYYYHRTSEPLQDQSEIPRHRLSRARHEIRGFCFEGNYEGEKIISIKADRFCIEKKKLGFFRFGLLNVARLTNAVVDIYGKRTQSVQQVFSNAARQKAGPLDSNTPTLPDLRPDTGNAHGHVSSITFNHVFSRKALPSFPVKRISSIIIEPVLVKLHDETSVVSQLTAASATIRLKRRDILFKGNVRVVSGPRSLKTDQLRMLPENAVIKTNRHFVLKTPEKQISGKRLTTDIFLSSH